MNTQDLVELAEQALRTAVRRGAADASIICHLGREQMVRFSNNSVTVTKTLVNVETEAYVAKDRKRIIGVSSNPSPQGIKEFVERLVRGCELLPETPDYVPLPRGGQYRRPRPGSRTGTDTEMLDACQRAIDAASTAGARRVSGALTRRRVTLCIRTSSGAKGIEESGSAVLNVRAFADGEASGHGLTCAPGLTGMSSEEAGTRAGEYARSSVGAKPVEEGIYDVVMSPTVAADLFQHVGGYSSAFYVDAGISFLKDKLGQKVAAEALTIWDDPSPEGGLNRRRFDDEGVPTKSTAVIRAGKLETYLHNSTTARKFRAATTGNAGIIAPHPWNLVIDPGGRAYEELIRGVKKGLLVTNNWYTRFQNTSTGEYSTLPRDASFLIENGLIARPVSGTRISDNLPRQLKSLGALSKERRWVQWWEVSLPTLAPWILVRDVPITRALG